MMREIKIWRFEDAPEEYRRLSMNGGDEDWIAFIPSDYIEKHGKYIGFLEEGGSYGCCSVNIYNVDGGEIRIGCHA